MAGYTGVLLGNTANPFWRERRLLLPLLFMSSAAASTAGVLQMMPLDKREEKVVQRFGLVGKAGEAACMVAMQRNDSAVPEVAAAAKEGKGGVLWTAAKAALVSGILVELLPVRSPLKRKVSGALTTIGGICLRFALLEAGKAAAREPQTTIALERGRMRR